MCLSVCLSTGGGTPPDGGGTPARSSQEGTPPGQAGGTPRDGVPRGTGQQMEYLIRCGRYASCVHAGGLSCFKIMLDLIYKTQILSRCSARDKQKYTFTFIPNCNHQKILKNENEKYRQAVGGQKNKQKAIKYGWACQL